MNVAVRVFLLVITLIGLALSQDKGSSKSAPPPSAFTAAQKTPSPPVLTDSAEIVTVTLLAVVGETGRVSSAQVLHGVDKQIDKEAVKAIRSWHFEPAKKDGHPVPVMITVEVNFSRDKDGKLQLNRSSSPAIPNETGHTKP